MPRSRKLTRRQALRKCSRALAAGLAAPLIAPRAILGSAEEVPPSDRIGVGYIGCGRRSQNLRGLPKDGKIVAATDCCLPRAEETVKSVNGKAFQDYRRLLDLKEVDAVVIASPDHWHALHTVHACQAGKDAYVEKPLSLTIREGRLMVQAARKYGRIVQCGSQQRSMAANRRGCEIVRNGILGKVHTVVGFNYPSPWECRFPGQPVPPGLDWDLWCGPTEPVPFHPDIFAPRTNPGWISFRPWSGGEMLGWGAHGLDQVQWALGMDKSGPVEVWTEGERFQAPVYAAPAPREAGEAVTRKPKVRFLYPGGIVLKLDDGPMGGAVFIGEKGKISIDRGKFVLTPEELGREPLPEGAIRLYESDDHMRNWFACMRSRKLPAADVEIGHRSATVGHLGNIARWVGRKLRWDPEKEVFVDDREANAHLDRPRRKGFEIPDAV
ncbi:MAG: Gfo/Idh/MocA family protein [Planctomycetota bacterium]